jgi:hypothetical protein
MSSDDDIAGVEEMYNLRIAYEERQRLAQHVHGSRKEEMQLAEVRIENLERNLKIIQWNQQLIARYTALKAEVDKRGLTVNVDPAAQMSAEHHLSELDATLRTLMAFKEFRMLSLRRSEGKAVMDAQFREALAALPSEVTGVLKGKPAKVVIDQAKFRGMDPKAILSDTALAEAETMLDRQIELLLSYQQGMPGIRPEHAGQNPVDVFYTSYLQAVAESSRVEELRLNTDMEESDQKKKLIQEQRVFRTSLTERYKQYQHDVLQHFIGGIEQITTGMFDTEHGNESDAPKDWSAFLAEHPELKGDMERQWNNSKSIITEHRKLVDDVFDLKITDIDDWRYIGENAYKHARFGGVIQLIDGLARVNALPKVLSNEVARTASQAVAGETATDYVLPKVTFQQEAHRLLQNVRKAWQLPDTVDVVRDGKKSTEPFDPLNADHWDAIPEEQWQKINERIKTTREALLAREDDVKSKLAVVESDAVLVDRLWKLKHPMDLVDVKPDQELYDKLSSGEVKLADIMKDEEALKRSPARLAAVWLYVILEMQAHAGEYAEAGGVLQEDLFRLQNEKLDANRDLNNAARDNEWPWWAYALLAWYGKNIVLSVRHTTLVNSIPFVKWGYRLTVGAGYEAAQDVARLYRAGEYALSPASRTASYLNRYAGMKAVEFADDAERAAKAIEGLREAKILAQGRSAVQMTKIEHAIARAHNIPATGPGGTWLRSDLVQKWKILKEAGLQATEIKYLLRNGWCGREAEQIAMLLARNGAPIPKSLAAAGSTADDLARWREFAKASNLEGRLAAQSSMDALEVGGRVLGGVALAWQGYVAFERWQTAVATPEIVEQKKQYLRNTLVGNTEVGEPGLGFKAGEKDGEYVHEASGISISLKSLEGSLDAETYARYAEAINASAGVAILAVSIVAGGPVGLVIGVGGMIIEVTIDATIGEWEMGKKKEFLKNAPAWLLTAISVAGTLNESSFSMINGLADDEWSDWMADLSQEDKVDIRHKLLFSALCEDLSQNAPGAMGDLFAEKQGAGDISFVDTFYKGDFQRIVLPLFYARLAEQFDNTTAVRWSGSMQLKDVLLNPLNSVSPVKGRQMDRLIEAQVDPKTNFIARATPLQIRTALRDAVVAYMPYVHAARALHMRQRLAKIRSEKGVDADETVSIGGREIRLTEVIALLNTEVVYGTAENGWKPRTIGDVSDEDLASLNVPFSEMGSTDRAKLYGQYVQDPLLRMKLGSLYEQEPGSPDFKENSRSEVLAFFAIHQQTSRGQADAEKRASAGAVVYAPELLGGGRFAPRDYTLQRITEQSAMYFAKHPGGGYGRVPEWEKKLFPDWTVTRVAPNGTVVACPRPLVLISERNTITTDGAFDHTALATQLMDIAPKAEDPYFRNSNLEAVTLDFSSFTYNEGLGGRMPSNLVQATFFFVDSEGRSYTLRRSIFIGKETVKKEGKWDREWRYTRGSDMYYHASEFELDPKNRQMREWVELSLRDRVTADALSRSNERGRPSAEFDPHRQFFRADHIGSALYSGETVQPALHLSLPAGVEITPNSPAMRLLAAVAKTRQVDPRLPYEADPSAVFVEFDLLPDGTLTALATHLENYASTSDDIPSFSDTDAVVRVHRSAASLRYTSAGYASRPIQGLEQRTYLRDCPSLFKYFGDREAIVTEAFNAPKRQSQMLLESATLGYLGEGYADMLSDRFVTLPSGESLIALDPKTTALFISRMPSAKQVVQVDRSGGKEQFYLRPASFDRIILHHDDNRADREYTVTNAYDLMADIRLNPAERERIIDLYCTPQSDAKATLTRLLGLFSHEVQKDGTGNVSSALVESLVPRYEAAKDKNQFLRGMFEQILRDGWINKGNLAYLSQALPVSLREGAVTVPVTTHHSVSVYLHDNRLVVVPPLKDRTRYDCRLAEFTERPDNGYNFDEIQAAYEAGKPVTLVIVGQSPLDGKDSEVTRVPLNLLTRQRDMEKVRSRSVSDDGDFVRAGSREFRRVSDLIMGKEVVMNMGIGDSGRAHDVRIDGAIARQFGPHAVLLREIDRNGGIVRMKYIGNALQLWDAYGRKLPADMKQDELQQYEKDLSADKRAQREVMIAIDRWTIEQLTSPVIAERTSEDFVLPVRRIIDLFPCTLSVEMQQNSFLRFRSEVEAAYKDAADPTIFLQTLYREMEQAAKGKPIVEGAQLNAVRAALGIPEYKEQK